MCVCVCLRVFVRGHICRSIRVCLCASRTFPARCCCLSCQACPVYHPLKQRGDIQTIIMGWEANKKCGRVCPLKEDNVLMAAWFLQHAEVTGLPCRLPIPCTLDQFVLKITSSLTHTHTPAIVYHLLTCRSWSQMFIFRLAPSLRTSIIAVRT